MAEQTFRSPGFFDREIDLSQRTSSPTGIPAGIIGTSKMGPAFVPVTVGNFADFETRFGTLDPQRFGPYAVNQFLRNRTACTFIRVLGAGSNKTQTQINTTLNQGTVTNAGFVLSGSTLLTGDQPIGRQARGCVQFIAARHYVSAALETTGYPIFSDNDSFQGTTAGNDIINLLRGVLFTATGTCFQILDYNQAYSNANVTNDLATVIDGAAGNMPSHTFKLVLSNSDGVDFGEADGQNGIKIYTASLDPDSNFYISKILNTDPIKLQEKKHLLYNHFPVSTTVANLSVQDGPAVGLLSGSQNTSLSSGDKTEVFEDAFGRFDTRYTTPRTTYFISQPMGGREWDLFYFETISDGEFANDEFKISIANIRASSNPANPFGTFDVQVRKFDDTDMDRVVLEQYTKCNLDRDSDRFIGRLIGDKKVFFDHDATTEDERRISVQGRFANRSSRIRVQINEDIYKELLPGKVLPFGFRGIPTLKTTDSLTDQNDTTFIFAGKAVGSVDAPLRLAGAEMSTIPAVIAEISSSIVPPLPYRFKVTRGAINSSAAWVGQPGNDERVDTRFYWGVQCTAVPVTGTFGAGTNDILRPNEGTTVNHVVQAYTRFSGIQKLDTLVTGTGADMFNNNKFTLANVALPNTLTSAGHISQLTGTVAEHMKGAAYVRNARPSVGKGLVLGTVDTTLNNSSDYPGRITLATLLGSSSVEFNRFTEYTKYTNIFHGGFDGLNILDKDEQLMNDRAASNRTGGGKAATDFTDSGLGTQTNGTNNPAGTGIDNQIVLAYRNAARTMSDFHITNINILAIPGIRVPLVTDYAGDKARDNGQVFNVVDVEGFDENGNRIYDDSTSRPGVEQTTKEFDARNLDNNYSATYFPDVFITDVVNNQITKVPASIAAISALGFNDRNAKPWFAPAGFNRASLGFVTNTAVRLSAADRDTLYDGRINPIANFPNGGAPQTFVIFGQKDMQLAQSALDRINVRRMLIEVKRLIFVVARNLLFEQNNQQTRARFVSSAAPLLALVQAQQGIEQFKIVMDDSNNSTADVEGNRLNGRIVIVPTRAVEFVAIDFIITATGVSFE